ncbi:MAG: LamG domain-containing protein [Akkermansiaceae bacterium]
MNIAPKPPGFSTLAPPSAPVQGLHQSPPPKRKLLAVKLLAIGLLFGASVSASNADLIAYWPFDEGVGETAEDVVGGFNGTISGGTWFTPGKVGASALDASGGEEVNCPAEATPTTDDLTLAWWMIDNHESYGTIMDKSIAGSGKGYNVLVRPLNEDSPLRFRIGGWQDTYGGWGAECRLPAEAYKDGEWVHIVCTYDSTTDTASIYVNGELATNGANNPKTGITGDGGYCESVNNADTPLLIRGGEEIFNGVLDEVAIWDHALTPEEVMAVYTGGPLGLSAGKPLAISAIDYSPGAGELSLSWDSREGEIYAVKYSTDLINWDSDVEDSVLADAGESTTRVFDLSDLSLPEKVYFRVEKQ